MKEIIARRAYTASWIDDLRLKLSETERLVDGRACVYTTGSFGRKEACSHSDLDLFIVGSTTEGKDGQRESMLSFLSEILVKSDLIRATLALNIRDFDGDGKYLVHHATHLLTETLGKPEDDAFNTFTPRLLLLLESYPLVEESIHSNVINEVIAAYWRDYEGCSDRFVPAFLGNDILRLWRTFCVNYEARTERQPEQKRWKRKTKNYKLKFSRLLTCYSALLYLLFTFGENGTVHPEDVVYMVRLSPTERIENLCANSNSEVVKNCLKNLLDKYNNFLKVTDMPEDDLIKQFGNKDVSNKHFEEAKDFGASVFEALNRIGLNNEFHRLLVV